MKRLVSATTLVCIALLLVLQTVGLAWLTDNGRSSIADITSNVRQSYFESGDGTAEFVYDDEGNVVKGPYEIKRPVQLYYFAWLQYLGYFNVDNNNDDKIDTVYFWLSEDIDMDYIDESTGEHFSYVLPPIGTTKHPFLGNFDGCGHTITDLTVKNLYGALLDPPNGVDELGFGGAEIIGFFGVIGELKKGDYDYSSEANEVKNVVLENITVKTETANALIGIVAGYVNGKVDSVGVVGSTVIINENTQPLSYTDNISDFSLIGYCDKEFQDRVYVMDVVLTNPDFSDEPYIVIPEMTGDGDGQGWGGSVAMKDICTWLLHLKNNKSQTVNFVTSRVDKVMLDGSHVGVGSPKTSSKKATTVSNFGSFIFDPFSGDYNFMNGSISVVEYKYEYTGELTTVYVITDGENYVGLNGTNIINVTDPDQAAKWHVHDEENGTSLSTIIGNRGYYLTISGGKLSVTDDLTPEEIPVWSDLDGGLAFDSQKVEFSDGSWQVEMKTYYISNGSRYLHFTKGNNNNNFTISNDVRDKTNAMQWKMDISSGSTTSTTISTVVDINGVPTTYYLGLSGSSLTLTTTAVTWTYSSSNRRLSARSGNTTYYLRYSNGWGINRYQGTQLTFEEVESSSSTSTNVKIEARGQAEGFTYKINEYIENLLENYYYDANGQKQVVGPGITYFPLSSDVDTEKGTFSASINNTGYIIGSNWGDIDRNENNTLGNVRISRYSRENNLTNYAAPYTITYKSDGVVPLDGSVSPSSLGLQKYSACVNDYLKSVGVNEEGKETPDDDDCYGIHFMKASVTMSNIALIDAVLNGETFEDYQMPTNCIDFSLYENGFINFFAGSYYKAENPPNDSFFSIYEIIRNQESEKKEILEIREISKVYAILDENDNIVTTEDYRYTYTVYTTDSRGNIVKSEVGEEDIPTSEDLPLNERYQMVFNCEWITDSSNSLGDGWEQDSAYYFEVPVNAGEYAIGSTYNKTGAYLIYLDLAANAQRIERTQQYEEITIEETRATIPKGDVEVLEEVGDGEKYNTTDIDSINSAFVSISNGTSGEITFEKTEETITHTAANGTNAEYIGVGTTIKDGNGQEMTIPIYSTTKIQRTTYIDQNLHTGESTVTVITVTTLTTAESVTVKYHKKVTSTVVNEDGSTTVTESEEESEDKKLTPDTPDPEDFAPLQPGAELINLGFAYGQDDDLVVTYEFTPEVLDENGDVVAAATYVITIENGSGENVSVRAILTATGANSNITFVITDGNSSTTTLAKTTDAQTVTIPAQN